MHLILSIPPVIVGPTVVKVIQLTSNQMAVEYVVRIVILIIVKGRGVVLLRLNSVIVPNTVVIVGKCVVTAPVFLTVSQMLKGLILYIAVILNSHITAE